MTQMGLMGASLQSVEAFVSQLKRLQIVGSNRTALETAHLLRTVISQSRWNNAATLIATIKQLAVRLVRAQPVEFAVGNVIRRVLHLIREEYKSSLHESHLNYDLQNMSPGYDSKVVTHVNDDGPLNGEKQSSGSSNTGSTNDSSMWSMMVGQTHQMKEDYSRQCFPLKQLIIQGVNEIVDELEAVESLLAQQAADHIGSDDTIMTIGRSCAVEKFLLAAARKKRFTVIVAEGASSSYAGHRLANNLSEAGLDTLLVSDAAVHAVMPRVSKVLIGCHAVTANGGVMAPSGCLLLADAAAVHATPLCVVAGLYKLTPIFPERDDSYNRLANPSAVLPHSSGDLIDRVTVLSPQFDFLAPSFVDLFITNTGGHPPSYVYRLMREMYDLEDYVLC